VIAAVTTIPQYRNIANRNNSVLPSSRRFVGYSDYAYWQHCKLAGVWSRSRILFWSRFRLWALSALSGLICNFVAVHLTSVQFILQLKLCLYTIVHLLLEEISLKSCLSTQSLCHTVSPRVGFGVWFWARSRSRRPGFLRPESESESHKNQGLRIPANWVDELSLLH